MTLRFPLFVDARTNAEQDVEFDVDEIESVEETTRGRLFAGTFKVTKVRLRGDREYRLEGHFGSQIEAQRKSRRNANPNNTLFFAVNVVKSRVT